LAIESETLTRRTCQCEFCLFKSFFRFFPGVLVWLPLDGGNSVIARPMRLKYQKLRGFERRQHGGNPVTAWGGVGV